MKFILKIKNIVQANYYLFVWWSRLRSLGPWPLFIIILILTVVISSLLCYKFLFKSLLVIFTEITIVEKLCLIFVIFIMTNIKLLIFWILKKKDITFIDYIKIAMLSILSIVIFLLTIEIISLTKLSLAVIVPHLFNSISLENCKLAVNNILSADRYSGTEKGESSKNAEGGASNTGIGYSGTSNNGASSTNNEVNNSSESNYTKFTEEDQDSFTAVNVRARKRLKNPSTFLSRHLQEEDILNTKLIEAENKFNSNPVTVRSGTTVQIARDSFASHQKDLVLVYDNARIRKAENLNDIAELKRLSNIFDKKIAEETDGSNLHVLNRKKNAVEKSLTLFENDNKVLDESLNVFFRKNEIRAIPTDSLTRLPNINNRLNIYAFRSGDTNGAEERLNENKSILNYIRPLYENLNKSTVKDPNNISLKNKCEEVGKMIDKLDDENEILSDKHGFEKSISPEDR